MICIIALIVFGMLSLFSAQYRPLAREALDCFLRRITFKGCKSGLDVRLKAQITARFMARWPYAARLVFRNFELLSWIFLILMVTSSIYTGIGIYNYSVYGNCNGKVDGESFCIFDPAGNAKFSGMLSNYTGPVVNPGMGNSPRIGPDDANVSIVEFGCYMCKYTRKAEPTVKRILKEYQGRIIYTFRDFPVSNKHENAHLHSLAARCANEQGRFWEFRDFLFENQDNMTHDTNGMKELAVQFGLDQVKFNECMDSEKYMPEINEDANAGIMAGVYGTPTFFINNKTIVGPQDYKKFQKIIEKEFAKNK